MLEVNEKMMADIWAVIPVKPLNHGKSRLGSVLDSHQRRKLNQFLLENTIDQIKRVNRVARILIVSSDLDVFRIVKSQRISCLLEESPQDLNRALMQATDTVVREEGEGILIVPADLPNLKAEILDRVIALSSGKQEMVISPDRHEEGTNVMLLFPPGMVEYCYGKESFHHHIRQAAINNMRCVIYRDEALGFDLDLPEDLNMLIDDPVYQHLLRKDLIHEPKSSSLSTRRS